jgi:hypothetical protein
MALRQAKLLPTPCWWVDCSDPWEIMHYSTREAAEQQHVNMVRADEGYPLSIKGVFEVAPGELVQETERCYQFDCPACGDGCHLQERSGECVWCGALITISNSGEVRTS